MRVHSEMQDDAHAVETVGVGGVHVRHKKAIGGTRTSEAHVPVALHIQTKRLGKPASIGIRVRWRRTRAVPFTLLKPNGFSNARASTFHIGRCTNGGTLPAIDRHTRCLVLLDEPVDLGEVEIA